MAKPNILIRSKKAQANKLLSGGLLHEAESVLAGICLATPADAESWAMRGLIQRKLGLFEEAEAFCRRALKLKPDYAWGHHVLGSALQCQGRTEEALTCYRKSISLQPDNAEAHYFLANALRETGAINEAVNSYRQAIKLAPEFVEAVGNLGIALTSLGQLQEAANLLNRANALRPNTAEIIFNMGRILQRNGRLDEALEKYRRALNLSPDAINILGRLVETLEMTNRIEEAQKLIDRALPHAPDSADLIIPAAKLARRAKKFDEAIILLEGIKDQKLDLDVAGDVHIQLGQLYDRKGDGDRAFFHVAEGNRLVALSTENIRSQHHEYVNIVEARHGYLTPELANTPMATADAADPVFLFGFARSGTTLLGQILDSHPKLQTLDEKGMVAAMGNAFEQMPLDSANPVAELNSDQIAQLRKVYFDEAVKYVRLQPECLLVDKNPLNTTNVALIWRVFPRAKIILAIRHPCDVCLSCFMQNFSNDGALTSFITLEGGASVYAKVMQIWVDAAEMLPLNYHRIRYEDLVADFEHEARTLLDFLGVGWHESVREHDKHAMSHGKVNTPSYHQVTQPIYQHAKYRWKRYTKQMEAVMPVLRPYIEYFGYGAQTAAKLKEQAL